MIACVFAAKVHFLASFASALPTVTDPVSGDNPTSTSFMLFKGGDHVEGLNGVTFRIPGVIRTNAGTLLAFKEGRAKSNKDYDNINVMYKRGVNNGQTAGDWSTLMQAASIGDDTIGNPTPVVDR
ncbi:hypothetical protein AN958_08812 [Leucoagaricus sp. SymC.cos]|nr:hypothetical protein AN958_08812 [Leucoagaricus sp. SymC.cos]